jgi:hypothetical protein
VLTKMLAWWSRSGGGVAREVLRNDISRQLYMLPYPELRVRLRFIHCCNFILPLMAEREE